MRYYSLFWYIGVLSLLLFSGCEKKPIGGVVQMHWDRDMCERCKMAISERKFAAQIIDPQTGKSYKFDDIGCAVLWMEENGISWREKAIIWVTDAKSGEWIDARKANYVSGAITPMAFGFAAYSKQTLPSDVKVLDYSRVSSQIEKIEHENKLKVKEY